MITINNLVKRYDSHYALNGVTCSIPSQSTCAIVGPNGAGKSTLLKILTKIIDYDAGTIDYGSTLCVDSFSPKVGYLPEQRGLYTGVDIESQLLFFTNIRGITGKKAIENVNYWLNRLDIGNWRHCRVSELSKGMQQKVQFVSCLVSNPKIMFMDEPFSGVDPINFRLFIEILQEYQKEANATIVLSTHNMKSVEQLCKDVVLLNRGKVVIAGNVNDVKLSYSKGNVLSVELVVANGKEAVDSIRVKLHNAFKIISTHIENGHLFVEILDTSHSSYSESMQHALHLLKDYEVYQCSRKIMSMEDIFIELNK